MTIRKLPFLVLTLFALLLTVNVQAQKKSKKMRKSPTVSSEAQMGDTDITIKYGSPAVKGRKIWGGLVPFGKVWRTGANEATTFEVTKAVMIDGQELPAGKYALFTIPGKQEWTFILNADHDQWGAYNYDEDKDVLRFTAKPGKTANLVERMAFNIATKGGAAAAITFTWENVAVSFKVTPAE